MLDAIQKGGHRKLPSDASPLRVNLTGRAAEDVGCGQFDPPEAARKALPEISPLRSWYRVRSISRAGPHIDQPTVVLIDDVEIVVISRMLKKGLPSGPLA